MSEKLDLIPDRYVVKHGEQPPFHVYYGELFGVSAVDPDTDQVIGTIMVTDAYPTEEDEGDPNVQMCCVVDDFEVDGASIIYTWPRKSIAPVVAEMWALARMASVRAKLPHATVDWQGMFTERPFKL